MKESSIVTLHICRIVSDVANTVENQERTIGLKYYIISDKMGDIKDLPISEMNALILYNQKSLCTFLCL